MLSVPLHRPLPSTPSSLNLSTRRASRRVSFDSDKPRFRSIPSVAHAATGLSPQPEEPILIDDTTDEEADAQRPPSATPDAGALDPEEAAGAPGPAARRRSTRHGGGGGGGANFQTLSEKLAGLKCCYPPDGGKHSVEVTAEDLARLEPRQFLNDTCIDFYIKWVGVRGTEGAGRGGQVLCTMWVAGMRRRMRGCGRSEQGTAAWTRRYLQYKGPGPSEGAEWFRVNTVASVRLPLQGVVALPLLPPLPLPLDPFARYVEHTLPQEIRARCHFFNSFFLKKLQEKPKERMSKDQAAKAAFERVKKWTKVGRLGPFGTLRSAQRAACRRIGVTALLRCGGAPLMLRPFGQGRRIRPTPKLRRVIPVPSQHSIQGVDTYCSHCYNPASLRSWAPIGEAAPAQLPSFPRDTLPACSTWTCSKRTTSSCRCTPRCTGRWWWCATRAGWRRRRGRRRRPRRARRRGWASGPAAPVT